MFWLLLLCGGLLYVLAQFVLKTMYISNFVLLAICVLLFLTAFFFPAMELAAKLIFFILMAAFTADLFFLFALNRKPLIERYLPERLSNGDENPVMITVQNNYPFTVKTEIVDELPPQFQLRTFSIKETLKPGQEKEFRYKLRPIDGARVSILYADPQISTACRSRTNQRCR